MIDKTLHRKLKIAQHQPRGELRWSDMVSSFCSTSRIFFFFQYSAYRLWRIVADWRRMPTGKQHPK